MKFWDLIRTANANLWHNKLRTILTIVAIFVGGFVITLMAGVNAGVNEYISKQLNALGGKDLIMVSKQEPAKTNDINVGPSEYNPDSQERFNGTSVSLLNDSNISAIGRLRNIVSVSPYISSDAEWVANSKPGSKKYVIAVSPVLPGVEPNLAAGKLPDVNSSDNQIAILTSDVSALGFSDNNDAIGKTVEVGVKNPTNQQIVPLTATVVGVQNTTLVGNGGAVASNSLLTKMSDIAKAGYPAELKNRYVIALATMKSDMTDQQVNGVKSNLKDKGFHGQTMKDAAGIIEDVVNAVSTALIGFGAIALLAASFGIINTLFMSVQERTKEIGLMKAMGMSRAKVFLLFAFEAILIGFWGSLISVLAAIGVGNIINHVAATTFLKNLEGFTLLQFNFVSIASVMLIVMLIAFLAGTLPARRASRKDPIEALRYE